MDVIQSLHRVAGHDDALMVQHSSTPALSSETSLQLKPGKREYLPPLQTSSRTDGSEQTSPGHVPRNAGFADKFSQPEGIVNTHMCPQNDLDKAIEQAQATKDLVSVDKYEHADLRTD